MQENLKKSLIVDFGSTLHISASNFQILLYHHRVSPLRESPRSNVEREPSLSEWETDSDPPTDNEDKDTNKENMDNAANEGTPKLDESQVCCQLEINIS